MIDRVLKTDEAASHLGLSVSTLEKMRVYGNGPRFVRAVRAIRYRPEDLQAYLAARVVGSTSEKAAA